MTALAGTPPAMRPTEVRHWLGLVFRVRVRVEVRIRVRVRVRG